MMNEESSKNGASHSLSTQKKNGSGILIPHSHSSMVDDILTVKDRVFHILETVPATRDSDKLLIMRFLVETKVGYYVKNGLFIPYSHFDDLPSFESIRRVRQKFQEQGLFLASEKVKELREINEYEMHSVMLDGLEVPQTQRRLEV